jgi:hypothetical protein
MVWWSVDIRERTHVNGVIHTIYVSSFSDIHRSSHHLHEFVLWYPPIITPFTWVRSLISIDHHTRTNSRKWCDDRWISENELTYMVWWSVDIRERTYVNCVMIVVWIQLPLPPPDCCEFESWSITPCTWVRSLISTDHHTIYVSSFSDIHRSSPHLREFVLWYPPIITPFTWVPASYKTLQKTGDEPRYSWRGSK